MARLRATDVAYFDWLPAPSWAEAVESIRIKPVEIGVVDPLLSGEPRTHEIERLRVLFPSLPLVVYTPLTPDTAGILLKLGRAGIQRALFYRFDDSPSNVRRTLLGELEQSASQQVLVNLGGILDELPSQLRWAFEGILNRGEDAATVSDLADRAQLKRRTCERMFAKVGLPSPRMVMVLARVLYAHRLLLDPGYTVEDVALKLGYTKAKTLQMHLREVFGLTAGELRISLSAEDAMTIVKLRYFAELSRVAS